MKHNQVTDELQEQASLYAVGAMSEDERLQYERHLEEDNCAVCRKEANELQNVATFLAFSAPVHVPPPGLKARLTEQARSAPAAREKPRKSLHWIFDCAAGLAALAAIVLLVVSNQANRELRNLTAALSNRIVELEAQNEQQRVLFATVTSPDVRVVNLAGQGINSSATGRIFWDEQARRWLFYVRHLNPAPGNRTYQLWFVPAAGNPVSAAIFNTLADGSAVMEVAVPGSIDALKAAAVTTEPAGGLPQPSGAYALLGAVE